MAIKLCISSLDDVEILVRQLRFGIGLYILEKNTVEDSCKSARFSKQNVNECNHYVQNVCVAQSECV